MLSFEDAGDILVLGRGELDHRADGGLATGLHLSLYNTRGAFCLKKRHPSAKIYEKCSPTLLATRHKSDDRSNPTQRQVFWKIFLDSCRFFRQKAPLVL